MRIAYLMNGEIGVIGSKNYEASKSDIRKKIIEYTSKTHHFINNDVEIDYFIFCVIFGRILKVTFIFLKFIGLFSYLFFTNNIVHHF